MLFRDMNNVILGVILLSPPVFAQVSSNLADLTGVRAAGGEAQLESRGYRHIKTDKSDDQAWSYWWQPQRRECMSVAIFDGRFNSITATPPGDCSQGVNNVASANDVDRGGQDEHGYRSSVNVNDLVTRLAPSADVELQRRGFRTVRAYKAGETAYTIRSNDGTGQCVQVAVKDGRVRYIAAIRQNSCR